MTWQMYRVVFRLLAPMHIGWNKIGNVQHTRPYLTGRSLWGALTMRITRNRCTAQQSASDSALYQQTGEEIHTNLAYTYFYPALKLEGDYEICWPWENRFAARFLSSYASTALLYPQQAADEGTLHEVEYISPYTVDEGEPVYLVGYIFERNGISQDYRNSLSRLQFGGERSYGWGRVAAFVEHSACTTLFQGATQFEPDKSTDRPRIRLKDSARLLAHTEITGVQAQGEIEPLVGREWRSNNKKNTYVGQHVEYTGTFFTPGAKLVPNQSEPATFEIGRYGIWKYVS